jgi:hypothetical protein
LEKTWAVEVRGVVDGPVGVQAAAVAVGAVFLVAVEALGAVEAVEAGSTAVISD